MLIDDFNTMVAAGDALTEAQGETLMDQVDTWQGMMFTDKQLALSIYGWVGLEQQVANEVVLPCLQAINAASDTTLQGYNIYVDNEQETDQTPKEVAKRIIRWIKSLFD